MIEVSNSSLYKLKINATQISLLDRLICSQFHTYLGQKLWGMRKKYSHTIFIDLRKSEEELLQDCKSNTRNEVRRAIREEFFFEPVASKVDFVEFYNKFAEEKNIEQISLSHLNKYGPNILLYQSGKNGVVMTMHATMVDPESKFSMLLYSASVRLDQGVDKKDVGFSNRFLHYREFVEFKSLGYETYDFCGVCIDPNDKARYSIGQFKSSFGGTETDTLMLFSYPFVIANFIKSILGK